MEKHVEDAISGGLWLFLGNLSISLLGFLFWMILSRVVGVEGVGVSSAIISAVSIAVTITSAGLNFAVIREVAANGARSFTASLVLAVLSSMFSTVIVQPLVYSLGYAVYGFFASVLAFITVFSAVFQFSLIGFEKFKEFFYSTLVGSLAKLVIGIVLAFLGYGVFALLLGYTSYPLFVLIVACLLLLPVLRNNSSRASLVDLKNLIVLMLSNYPYMFSNQLLTMLSIYVFAYLVREPVSTGILYLSFMIALAISAIPSSIISASLPIGTRRNVDPFIDSFRIGVAIATPVIVLAIALSRSLLILINPGLVDGVLTLEILLLSIAPLVALTTIITKLNKERRIFSLGLIGFTRLLALLALVILFVETYGTVGVALSYLLANIVVLIMLLPWYRKLAGIFATIWGIHILSFLISCIGVFNEYVSAIISLTVSIAVLYYARILTFNELLNITRIIVNTLKGRE